MEKGYKGLIVWKRSYELALEIYKISKTFPKIEQYGLVSQMRRAAISVSGNIAEGYERKHRKEYVQFLMIARGSLGEIETYLLFAKDLGYIDKDVHETVELKRHETIKILQGLIKSLTTEP